MRRSAVSATDTELTGLAARRPAAPPRRLAQRRGVAGAIGRRGRRSPPRSREDAAAAIAAASSLRPAHKDRMSGACGEPSNRVRIPRRHLTAPRRPLALDTPPPDASSGPRQSTTRVRPKLSRIHAAQRHSACLSVALPLRIGRGTHCHRKPPPRKSQSSSDRSGSQTRRTPPRSATWSENALRGAGAALHACHQPSRLRRGELRRPATTSSEGRDAISAVPATRDPRPST